METTLEIQCETCGVKTELDTPSIEALEQALK